MGLEIGTYVDDLNINNPLSGDLKSVGDNHLRLIKQTLKNTFPNATKPFPFPRPLGVGTAVPAVIPASSNGLTYVYSTGSGGGQTQLPALTAADAGWECGFIKNSGDANALFIIPPVSTTLWTGEYPGLVKIRRAIPGRRFSAYWSGGEWFVSRVVGVPLGSVVSTFLSGLQPGYVWPNGVALSGATYPEYIAYVHGGGAIPDLRGRVEVGADQGVGVIGNVLGGTYGNAAGSEIVYLALGQVPPQNFSGITSNSVDDINHTHTFTSGFPVGACPFSGGQPQCNYGTGTTDGPNKDLNAHRHFFSGSTDGGGSWHSNMQPSYVMHKMLVVE